MAPKKVLVVLTSADKIDKVQKPTGWYLPELAHPYDVLKEKVELVFASPKGGRAPLDPGSVEQFEADPTCAHFLKHHQATWQTMQPLASFFGHAATEFDAVFYTGGHGPMLDLMNDADSHRIIELWRAGKPGAAVCHGPMSSYASPSTAPPYSMAAAPPASPTRG